MSAALSGLPSRTWKQAYLEDVARLASEREEAQRALQEHRYLTRRMLQALNGYWEHCDGLDKGRYPRGKYDAEDWWTRFEKYRSLLLAALTTESAHTRPTPKCTCWNTGAPVAYGKRHAAHCAVLRPPTPEGGAE